MSARTSSRYWLIAAAFFGGCASTGLRDLPVTAAAHPAAIEGPPRPVALSVRGDPPLPGEPLNGWPDLGRASTGHQHH